LIMLGMSNKNNIKIIVVYLFKVFNEID